MSQAEKISSKALRCVRYLQRFGMAQGGRNFVRTLSRARVVSLVDPVMGCHVAVRPRTSDILTFGQVFVARDYDFDFGDLAPKLIIDAGANVGHSTVFLARRFPEAQIIALEPESSNFEMLVQNTQRYPRVVALKKALWSRVCGLKISNPMDHNWAFQIVECDEDEEGAIEAITISEIIKLVGCDRVDLLKLDIEGARKGRCSPVVSRAGCLRFAVSLSSFTTGFGWVHPRPSTARLSRTISINTGGVKTFWCSRTFDKCVRHLRRPVQGPLGSVEGNSVPDISAIVTAYDRLDRTIATIQVLKDCEPAPQEVLVHVDGGRAGLAAELSRRFPDVQVIVSSENVGPGGGRNKLIRKARSSIVASFDDDSYPIDRDYFARVSSVFAVFPDVAVVGASFFEHGDEVTPAATEVFRVADFVGCASACRREAFLATHGYVARPIAYGVEEVDVALQLRENGRQIVWTPFLRVFHDTDLSHRANARTSASVSANFALVAFLRYPLPAFPVGAWPFIRYAVKLLAGGQIAAVVRGLGEAGLICWRYRGRRRAVTIRTLLGYFRLRRHPELLGHVSCP